MENIICLHQVCVLPAEVTTHIVSYAQSQRSARYVMLGSTQTALVVSSVQRL